MSGDEAFDRAVGGTDREWWEYQRRVAGVGFCGGCGLDDCHDGPCTEVRDRLLVSASVCGLCPERVATGQVAAASRREE